MKIILMVGYVSYEAQKKIATGHPDYMFVSNSFIVSDQTADTIMESIKMVDAVMFIEADRDSRLAYEVAAVMFKKPIVTEEMLTEEENTKMEINEAVKELSDTAKQIIVDTMRNPL